MSQAPDDRPRDPVEAVRPSEAGRRRGRLIPVVAVVLILLVLAFIIVVARLNSA